MKRYFGKFNMTLTKSVPFFKRLMFLWLCISFCAVSFAADIGGSISLEGRSFWNSSPIPEVGNAGMSVRVNPEFRLKFSNNSSLLTVEPFARIDELDEERTHFDIRQLDVTVIKNNWLFQAGISKLFWGVTESANLVDIVNQVDVVEDPFGDDKLGQPLFRASRFYDNGSVSLLLMPYFRKRVFPGKKDRFRLSLPIDTNNISYESKNEENNIDVAIRLQHTIDRMDFGLSFFHGTSRTPDLLLNEEALTLTQHYPLVDTASLDLQYTGDEWLWKLEYLNTSFDSRHHSAAVGGFEYTQPRFAKTNGDIGYIMEYHTDSRNDSGIVPFQNDLFLGARIAFNDLKSSEILIGTFYDADTKTKIYTLEASTHINDSIIFNVESTVFSDVADDDVFQDFKNDSNLQLGVEMYF